MPIEHLPARRGSSVRGRRERGLTLVELMISITIGLLIVGAVLYVYLGSRGAYRTSKSTSRVQEAGRFGLDAMMRDVRLTGFIGCGSRLSLANFQPQQVYQIANPPLNFASPTQAVIGYSATNYTAAGSVPGWAAPAGLSVPWFRGDVITLRVSTGTPTLMAKDPDPTIPAIYLANNCAKIKSGDYLLVSSCTMTTVLRVSNAPLATAAACPANGVVANPPIEIDHGPTDVNGNTVNGNPPGKLTALLPPGPGPTSVLSTRALAGAQPFDEVTYYVGQLAGRPAPALYRYSATNQVSEEIIDHVENMSIVYGVDGGAGNVVFNTADQVSAAGLWDKVISVRVSLLAVGDEAAAVDPGQTLSFGAVNASATPSTLTFTDTRLRQVFTATAALRDRLQ